MARCRRWVCWRPGMWRCCPGSPVSWKAGAGGGEGGLPAVWLQGTRPRGRLRLRRLLGRGTGVGVGTVLGGAGPWVCARPATPALWCCGVWSAGGVSCAGGPRGGRGGLGAAVGAWMGAVGSDSPEAAAASRRGAGVQPWRCRCAGAGVHACATLFRGRGGAAAGAARPSGVGSAQSLSGRHRLRTTGAFERHHHLRTCACADGCL